MNKYTMAFLAATVSIGLAAPVLAENKPVGITPTLMSLDVTHNGKKVLNANWGTAISKNPYLSFKLKGANKGDQLVLSWNDNLGNTDSLTSVVK